MKLIVSGTRDIWDNVAVKEAFDFVQREINVTEVITGGALGVDTLADKIAREKKLDRTIMPANCEKHKLSAGPRRNLRMANYGEVLLAVWDGESPGTRDMIILAEKYNMPRYIFLYDRTTKKITKESL